VKPKGTTKPNARKRLHGVSKNLLVTLAVTEHNTSTSHYKLAQRQLVNLSIKQDMVH
jgi:hypothetical protein